MAHELPNTRYRVFALLDEIDDPLPTCEAEQVPGLGVTEEDFEDATHELHDTEQKGSVYYVCTEHKEAAKAAGIAS